MMSRKLCMGCMTEYDTHQCGVCPQCGAVNSGIPKDASHLKPGTQLKQGRYIAGLSIDSGKYNITYIGCDVQTKQKIVIKEYFPREYCSRQKNSNQVEVKRESASGMFEQGCEEFSRNGQEMFLTKIPGMVRMRELFAENGTVYEIMDYLDGSTLEESLKGQKMSMGEILSIMFPVIETVCRLHEKGIFHLNIHPGNIFLLRTGEVFLMDIGRWKCNLEKKSKETTVNDYQAPELRIRDAQIGAGADIYSLCAVMNQMLRQEKKKTETYESQYNSMMNGLEPDVLRRTVSAEQLLNELLSVRRIERVPVEEKKASLKSSYAKESVSTSKNRDDSIKKSNGKNILFFAVPCFLIVIAAIGIFAVKSKKSASDNPTAIVKSDGKTVPNIVGSDVKTAEKTLKEQGITLTITDSEKASGEEVDKIISQSPEAEKSLDDSKTINVTVGAKETTIANELGTKNVYGHSYKENENTLSKLAAVFNPYTVSEESYIIPGYLIRIDQGDQEKHEKLGIDEKILQYKPITFVKSIGQKNLKTGQKTKRKVEDIKGENPMDSNIADWAENYQFYYGISDEEEYSVYPTSKGEVADIEINRDGNKIKVKDKTAIETGDEVVLILSKGPKKAKLESEYWTGKTKDSVTKYLKKYHIKTKFKGEYSDSIEKGMIIGESSIESPYKSADIDASQKNKDGSKAQYYEGDTINLIVSIGAKPVITEYKPSTGGGNSSSGGSRRKSSGGSSRKTGGSSSNKKTNQSKPNPGAGLN